MLPVPLPACEIGFEEDVPPAATGRGLVLLDGVGGVEERVDERGLMERVARVEDLAKSRGWPC
jgi:hypothetical protein